MVSLLFIKMHPIIISRFLSKSTQWFIISLVQIKDKAAVDGGERINLSTACVCGGGSDVISSVPTTWTSLASHFNMKQINISTFGGMLLLPGPTAQTDSRTREPQAAVLQARTHTHTHTHPKAAAVLHKTTRVKWVTVNREAQTSHKKHHELFLLFTWTQSWQVDLPSNLARANSCV